MSNLGCAESVCHRHDNDVEVIVRGRARDLGGFTVRRVLPASMARSVGPFVFFDEMGPAEFSPGEGINVRPHPHIGLATVTFLFEGEILHRDSLGYVQAIQPGAVNLMTAGRGIVHSERTAPERLRRGQRLHGLQVWMALPEDRQEIAPAFVHHPKDSLPIIESSNIKTVVVLGSYQGHQSPVELEAKTLYLAQELGEGAVHELETGVAEVAVYVVSGAISIGSQEVEPGEMAVLAENRAAVQARSASRIVIIGGEGLGPRKMFWNFVHTSQARIDEASDQWRQQKFDPVPGDDEFIPLP